MNPSNKIEIERIARAARIYVYNYVAAQALSIHPGTFSRLCRKNGIESPYARRRRRLREQNTFHSSEIAFHPLKGALRIEVLDL